MKWEQIKAGSQPKAGFFVSSENKEQLKNQVCSTRGGREGLQPGMAGDARGSQEPPPPGLMKAAPHACFGAKQQIKHFKTTLLAVSWLISRSTRTTRFYFNHHERTDASRCLLPSWGSARCLQAPEESSDEEDGRRARAASRSCSEEKCISFLETSRPTKPSSARHNEGITLCR